MFKSSSHRGIGFSPRTALPLILSAVAIVFLVSQLVFGRLDAPFGGATPTPLVRRSLITPTPTLSCIIQVSFSPPAGGPEGEYQCLR